VRAVINAGSVGCDARMDGRTPLGDIARALRDAFSGRFATWEAALSRAGEPPSGSPRERRPRGRAPPAPRVPRLPVPKARWYNEKRRLRIATRSRGAAARTRTPDPHHDRPGIRLRLGGTPGVAPAPRSCMQTDSPPPALRVYARPVLKVYGTARMLTLHSATLGMLDGGSGSHSMT